ncbi:MAG: hypothetical protein Q9208_007825 [Pyrenodesmia sp. 3 TL-2023]
MTILWFFKNRRASAAAASTTPTALAPAPAPTQQSGDSGNVPTTQVYPQKTEAPYTNQPLQQGNYPQQGQPQMQSYYEPGSGMQPNTNATSGPQGAAGEYYRQPPQSQPQLVAYPPHHAEMGSTQPTRDQTVSPLSAEK